MTPAEAFDVVWVFLAGTIGAGVLIAGLAKFFGERLADRWLRRVEARYAEQLATLQARLTHAVTVSGAQFEAEFAALREIWTCVARVRATLGAINPVSAPENETPDQRLARFVEARSAFTDAHNNMVRVIDNNSPFYPELIYAGVDAFRTRTALEQLQLHTQRPPFAPQQGFMGQTPDWYDRRRTAYDEVIAGAEAVSVAIRGRLASISIRE